MPKKIDDVINPKPEPNLIRDQLLAILHKAAQDELALTKQELLDAARMNWFEFAPIGQGGLLLALAAAAVDAEFGVSERMKELREATLDELVAEGRVATKELGDERYYWVADAPPALPG